MRYLLPLLLIATGIYFFADQPAAAPKNTLQLSVLDVGQGDSIYIRLPTGEDILIDAGPDDRVLAKLGTLMPIGDRTIELVIISHNHADHIGGFQAIANQYQISRLWISGAIHTTDQYLETLQLVKNKQIPTTSVKAGDTTKLGNAQLLVLFPPKDSTSLQPEDQHDATIAVVLRYLQFCALLTGDLADRHETTIIEIARSLNTSIACPVLKVTHHGSAYGSSATWLNIVKPKVAVISAGANNRYGHPAPSLLTRLRSIGATTYRTDQQGTVTVTSDGTQYWIKTEK